MKMMDLTTLPDEELVAYVCNNDSNAFREIVLRYENIVAKYVSFLLKNPVSEHEALQKVFIRAYRDLRGYSARRSFSNWLLSKVHDELSKTKRGFFSSERETIQEDFEESEVEFGAAVDPKLGAHFLKHGRKLALKYRDPLALHILLGKSIEDISSILYLPERTIAGRIAQGERRLRKHA